MNTTTERDLDLFEEGSTEEEKEFALSMALLQKLWDETIDRVKAGDRDLKIVEAFSRANNVTPDSRYAKLFELFAYGVNAGIDFATSLMTPPED